jgi:hypothetical protein
MDHGLAVKKWVPTPLFCPVAAVAVSEQSLRGQAWEAMKHGVSLKKSEALLQNGQNRLITHIIAFPYLHSRARKIESTRISFYFLERLILLASWMTTNP